MELAVILIDKSNVPDDFDLSPFIEKTIEKMMRLTSDIYFLSRSNQAPEGTELIHFETSNDFLHFISEKMPDAQVILMNAYSPLIDIESTRKMLDEQQRLFFDFTYPENLPQGLVPEIMVGQMAGIIEKALPKNTPLFLQSVRELFESDISSYDTNIFVLPSRLGLYRSDFIPNSYNNALTIQEVMNSLGSDLSIDKLEEKIAEYPDVIRRIPTYYEIRLHSDRESGALFASHRIVVDDYMSFDRLVVLLESISDLSYDPVVLFGFYGEPFLHPDIEKVLELLEDYPKIHFIFESRGFLTNFAPVSKALQLDNVQVIFDLSFTDQEPYAKYKKPYHTPLPFESLSQQEQKIKQLEPSQKVYPQLTRFTENEPQIGKFYEIWKDYQNRIIIKKPDTFSGELNEQIVVDLAPVKRHFCYHLKHDMLILPNGKVALNRHDINGEHSLGNVFDDGLEVCWNRLGKLYMRQWQSDFQDTQNTCNCDDWWVFNF